MEFVVFHTFTLQLPIQTLHSVASELQVFVSLLKNCQNFSKTSTPAINGPTIFLKNHKLKLLKGVSIAFSGRYYLKVGHGNGHLTHLHTPEQVAHWHRYGCHHQVRQFLLDSLHRMFPGKNCSPGVLLKAFNITRDCRQMCLFH